jgi:anti-sigma B factor antagonist
MQIETQKRGTILVVKLVDQRLDAHGAISFKAQIATIVAEGNKRIVLDLSSVSFIDSSGLGAVVSVLKLLGQDGRLVIACLQAPVLALFTLTRMDKVFAIFTDLESAVASL